MAVKRDANYAEAWAALSEMYAESHTTGFNPIERPVERALETAKKAQSLDPTNQIAQWSLAYVSRTRFPWTQNWLNRSVQGGPEHGPIILRRKLLLMGLW